MKKFIIITLLLFSLVSCGTSRVQIRVKSNSNGTLTSNVTISGDVKGGAVTPNVEFSADSSKVTIPTKLQ